MLFASVLFLSTALLIFTWHLGLRYEMRIRRLESEWFASVRHGLSQEFLFVEPKALRRQMHIVGILGAAVSIWTFQPIYFVTSLVAVWILPTAFLHLIQKRRRKLFEKQFTVVLPQLSSILHAGHTFERAIDSLSKTQPAPLSQEFELISKELSLGTPLDKVLENLCLRFPSRDLEIVSRAVSISRRVGSNLAEAFDRVAEMLRGRSVLRDRLLALTAQGRVQAYVAMAMPIALLTVLHLISPDYLYPLYTTTIGHLVLAGSAVGILIGGIWIHRISRMELMR